MNKSTEIKVKRLRAPSGYVRKPDAAERLGVQLRTVDNWMKRGLLKFHKVGRAVYFKESELLETFGETSPAPDVSVVSMPKPEKCKHDVVVDLPDSVFTWCRLCGAVRRKGNDPTVRWVLTTKRDGVE